MDSKYKKIFDKLKLERVEIMKATEVNHEFMMGMIDGWNGEGTKDVKKKDMKSFPILKWIELKFGVWIRRRLDIFDMVVFDTIIFEGIDFGMHLHSDCDEICDVMVGAMINLVDNETTNKGEMCFAKRNVYHHLISVNGEQMEDLELLGLPFKQCIGTMLRVYFK